jgi:L-asparagine transporter-like permease
MQYKRFDRPMRLLVWYIIAMSVIEWFERGLGMHHIQNLWLYHFSTPLELILTLGVFFYWSTEKRFRQLIVFFSIAFVLLCAVAIATFEPLSVSDDLIVNVSSAIQILCGITLLI